jgi:hypothetical protein
MDDGPAEALRARWDLDYDGTPDTPWQPIGAQPVRAGVDGFVNVRVEVRDGQGYVSATTTRIQVVPIEQLSPEDRMFDPELAPRGCACAAPGASSGALGRWASFATLAMGLAAVTLRRARRRARSSSAR